MVMTYREWVRTEYPHVGVLTVGGIETAGIMYRRYVERETDMDPAEYFHMSNDKGFTDWLKGVWSQLKDTGMKATTRNKAILWHIYKKRSTARLVKFIDENLVLREFYNPVPNQTPTEPADEERLERETYSQGLFTKSIQEHDPVNKPKHYTDGKIEVIDFIEDKKLGFNLGNTVKYIARAGKKDDIVQDLKKAKWYLEREIKKHES